MNIKPEASKEFQLLLEEFAYTILKNQPSDIYKFSADYFTDLYLKKSGKSIEAKVNGLPEKLSRADSLKNSQNDLPNRYIEPTKPQISDQGLESDEEDDDVMEMPDIKSRYHTKTARRQSVAAESLDPEKIDYSTIKVYEKSEEQKTRLKEAVKTIFIFRSLEKDQIPRLIDAMFEKTVEANETVIKQGDDGDNFYIIEKGSYEIIKDEKSVGTYENQGSFGELALMYNCPRAATIVAKTAGILWAMDRESFLKIVLHAAFKKRQMYEELLASASILEPLGEYERTNLADALMSRDYKDGDEICHEGQLGDEMFFVESGEVVVLSNRGADKTEKELCKIEKGGYFGELALLTDGHRNATTKALGDVRLAVLDRSSFERLLGPCFELMKGQSKAYLDGIIAHLGQDAVANYPSLLNLLRADEKPADEKPTDEKPADEKPADEKHADEKHTDDTEPKSDQDINKEEEKVADGE